VRTTHDRSDLRQRPADAVEQLLVLGDITAGAAWAPAKQASLVLGLVGDATTVQFRFTPLDTAGRWQIDSVYIDPIMRR
jgi:hypothetical protein